MFDIAMNVLKYCRFVSVCGEISGITAEAGADMAGYVRKKLLFFLRKICFIAHLLQ